MHSICIVKPRDSNPSFVPVSSFASPFVHYIDGNNLIRCNRIIFVWVPTKSKSLHSILFYCSLLQTFLFKSWRFELTPGLSCLGSVYRACPFSIFFFTLWQLKCRLSYHLINFIAFHFHFDQIKCATKEAAVATIEIFILFRRVTIGNCYFICHYNCNMLLVLFILNAKRTNMCVLWYFHSHFFFLFFAP